MVSPQEYEFDHSRGNVLITSRAESEVKTTNNWIMAEQEQNTSEFCSATGRRRGFGCRNGEA